MPRGPKGQKRPAGNKRCYCSSSAGTRTADWTRWRSLRRHRKAANMTDKEGTLQLQPSGRWAVDRPGRAPVEITSGDVFRVEVEGAFADVRADAIKLAYLVLAQEASRYEGCPPCRRGQGSTRLAAPGLIQARPSLPSFGSAAQAAAHPVPDGDPC